MRGFTRWACAIGGAAEAHSVLGSSRRIRASTRVDSEEEEWGSFLDDLRVRLKGLRRRLAEIPRNVRRVVGRTTGCPSAGSWRRLDAQNVARAARMMLQKRVGRFFNGMTIEGRMKGRTKYIAWRVADGVKNGLLLATRGLEARNRGLEGDKFALVPPRKMQVKLCLQY